MAQGIIQTIVNELETPTFDAVNSIVSNVAYGIKPVVATGAIIYIVSLGYLIGFGKIEAPLSEFFINSLKLMVLVVLCTHVDIFNEYFVELIGRTIPDQIGSLLISSGARSTDAMSIKSGVVFDNIFDEINNVNDNFQKTLGFEELGSSIFGIVFSIVAGFGVILIAVPAIIAKIGVALILVVGPIFIALGMFNTTRSFLSAWLNTLMNFVILQILIYALIGLVMAIIQAKINNIDTNDAAEMVKAMGIIMGLVMICVMIAAMIPQIASSLASAGFALANNVMGRAANLALKTAGAGAGAAFKGGRALASLLNRNKGGSIAPK